MTVEEKWQKDHRERVARMPAPIRDAHTHCTRNGIELEKSTTCGCFYCTSIFPPSEIVDWVEEKSEGKIDIAANAKANSTALCPRCGIDSVIGSASGFPITTEFLTELKTYWF
jgi:hypothetical protein